MNDVECLPIWRLWGEEKAEDAIYTVYLKKVRYHRPTTTTLSHSDSEDEISHLEWETVRVRFVKAGTLKTLVNALSTDDGELETTYMNVFLATFRSFSTATEVLKLLLERVEELSSEENHRSVVNGKLLEQREQHKKTLVSVLHVWLDSYQDDFRVPPQFKALNRLLDFCEEYVGGTELHQKVERRLKQYNRETLAGDSVMIVNSATIDVNHRHHNNNNRNNSVTFSNGGLNFYLNNSLALRATSTMADFPLYKLPDVPVRTFAEQLTRMDVDVFKKLVPHQCLGAIWSRRDKTGSHEAATVLATVNQFNAVSFRVISTILMEPALRTQERAAIIHAWIDIAQELRLIKNFSSLKAILSGLQTNAVYRLRRTWQALSREKHEIFAELANIFSEENNQWTQRELLMREGTAKYADTVGENDRHLQKVIQRQNSHLAHISFGTIPYLGTFLTDLTMIDTAIPDTISVDDAVRLINFDKRRKEFEVLAQIKLLQGAANAYRFGEDPAFDAWFNSILVLDDRDAYQLSLQIEPQTNLNQLNPQLKKKTTNSGSGHQKNDSITSTSSSNSSQLVFSMYDFEHQRTNSAPNSPHILSNTSSSSKTHLQNNNSSIMNSDLSSPSRMSDSSSNSSLRSVDVSLNSSHSGVNCTNNNSSSGCQTPQKSDFYIVKVTFETSHAETDGIVLYKSIMLSNSERTPQVIRNAMYKLGLEGNPSDYTIAQVLPDKEMVLPQNANVYYALNSNYNLNLILRHKKTMPENGAAI